MRSNIFPIKPSFISKLMEDKECLGGEEDNLNRIGILGEDEIQGFLAVVSHEDFVHSPITLYEFLPTELLGLYKSRKRGSFILKISDPFIKRIVQDKVILRTDNERHFKLKNSCTYFRSCLKCKSDPKGTRICYKLDSRVGLLAVENLSSENFEERLRPIIEEYNKQNNTPDIVIFPKSSKTRSFIVYTCPFSGFWEIIFPIFHEKKIIGCIMMGQVTHGNISSKQVFEKFAGYLKNSSISLTKIEIKALKDSILKDFEEDNKQFSQISVQYPFIKFHLEQDYYTIESIQKNIISFENRLEKRIALHRHKYISEKFLKIKTEFQDEAQRKDEELMQIGKHISVLELAVIIENALKKITESFYNEKGFIRIFIVGPSNDKKLELLAASDRGSYKDLNRFYYDLNKLPKEIINLKKTISNKDDLPEFEKGFLKCLENGIYYGEVEGSEFIDKNDIVRYYPTLSPKVNFVIWKRYEYAEKFLESHNNGQFFIFKNAMLDFYTTIAASYATLWGSQIEKKLEDAVRIAGHESNQIIPRLIDSLKINFDNTSNLRELLIHELVHKKVEDLINYIDLLKFIQEKPAYIFKNQDLRITDIDIYELFLKLLNMYKIQANHKDIWIDITRDRNEKTLIPGDKVLFEHALNNLVDNAVKYCHRGTKIKLQVSEKEKSFNVRVISYGPQIRDKKRIFELYHREQESVEGLGIGMYIVKKVVEAHNWSIVCESSLLDELNIPCILYYLREQSKNRHYALISRCNNLQITKIQNHPVVNEKDFQDVVASKEKRIDSLENSPIQLERKLIFQPGPNTFSEEFEKQTFKNEFIIIINKNKQ